MELRMYVDESGSYALTAKLSRSSKRKARIFSIAAILADDDSEARLREDYERLLDARLAGEGGGFTLRELFDLYRRVTGRKPELKAGSIMNPGGPFSLLRDAPRETVARLQLELMDMLLGAAVSNASAVYIVIIDKVKLIERKDSIERRSQLKLDARVFALDFLLNRLALSHRFTRDPLDLTIVYDEVSDADLLRDYIMEGVRRGYIYNPRYRHLKRLNVSIVFRRSEDEPLIQLADIVAYAARSLRAGTVSEQEASVYRRHLRIAGPGKPIRWIEYV